MTAKPSSFFLHEAPRFKGGEKRRRFWQIGESEQKLRTPPPGEQFLFTVFFLFIEQNAAGVYVFAIKQKT